jgi:hypothetical protein
MRDPIRPIRPNGADAEIITAEMEVAYQQRCIRERRGPFARLLRMFTGGNRHV